MTESGVRKEAEKIVKCRERGVKVGKQDKVI